MILIFTGAGMSADSGLPTFRTGPDGLWENFRIDEVCHLPTFKKSEAARQKTFEFYNARKVQYRDALPHAGHYAITLLQDRRPDVKVMTTNVDGLHQKAGTKDVLHIHGSMQKMNCPQCTAEWDIGDAPFEPVTCISCGCKKTKPGVVFFYEQAPAYEDYYRAFRELKAGDTVIIVGTSFNVLNPIQLIKDLRKYHTVRIVVVDQAMPLEFAEGVIEGWIGTAKEQLPILLADL